MPFKRISADEVRSKLATRKEFLRDVGGSSAIVRAMKTPPSWNAEARTAKFVMSSEAVDRYGDIIVQAGLDIEHFMQNPTALMFHNSRNWPVGTWSDVNKVLNGRPKRTEGVLNFMPEGADPDADRAAIHVANSTIRTVSIGFRPAWDDIEMILDDEDHWTGGLRFNSSELLECSLVPIPANTDALVKDAGGDMVLAKELIEQVLDEWARSPEGLLIPRSVYEAKHFDLVPAKSTYIVDKSLSSTRSFVAKSGMTLKATTPEEAAEFVGARVALDPAHAENKDWPFDVLGRAEGEILDSYIVADGENKGVHALCVEFLTDDYKGMFRGIRADRFLLVHQVEKSEAEPDAEPEAEPEAMDTPPVALPKSMVVTVDADTAPIERKLGKVQELIRSIKEGVAEIFVKTVADEQPEPALPSAVEIGVAKKAASEALADLRERGII